MSGGFHERLLAQDLIDALWLEDLHGFRSYVRIVDDNAGRDAMLVIVLGQAGELLARGQRLRGMRPLALDGTLTHQRHGIETPVDATGALEALQAADWWPRRSTRLTALFGLARAQAARTFRHEARILASVRSNPGTLIHWEALTCLRDRPFHPLARAKAWGNEPGLDAPDYHAESGLPLQLDWVALRRNALRSSRPQHSPEQPIASALLNPDAFSELRARAQAAGTDDSYLWFPLHPWQRRQLSGIHWIDLGGLGDAWPTASLRSMAVANAPARQPLHLKVSLDVQALGARRTLPARYLHNGVLAQTCLAQVLARDHWLARHLLLCDERDWWALRQHDTLIGESGELACLLRRYPGPDQLPDGGWLLPMAACAVVTSDGDLAALRVLGAGDAQEAWNAFRCIARLLLEASLRCFVHGVMPELHGQNVLLVVAVEGSEPGLHGLVLRDHDTLRVCPALLAEAGVPLPDYAIDRSTPNTLVLDTPESLLAYLQTLGIGVNLYAIAAAIGSAFASDENIGWCIVREEIEALLRDGPLARAPAAAIAANALLEAGTWPFKQILAPLLARESIGTGMPSAMGSLANPLRRTES